MSDIQTTRLFRMRDDLSSDDLRAALWADLKPGRVYWLIGSRPSSLGGFIGDFCDTYQRGDTFYCGGRNFYNVPMRYVEPLA